MSRCKEIWEDLCRAHIGSDEKLLYGNFCYIFSAQLYFIWFAIFQSYGILFLLYEFIYQLHGIIFLLYGSWCHNFPALYSTFVGKPISHRNIVQLRVKLILHRITFQDDFVWNYIAIAFQANFAYNCIFHIKNVDLILHRFIIKLCFKLILHRIKLVLNAMLILHRFTLNFNCVSSRFPTKFHFKLILHVVNHHWW